MITWGCRGELCISILFLFPPSFPDGRGFGSARRGQYADVAQSVEHRSVPGADSRRWFNSNRLHHRRDLLPRSRTERKSAKVVFPVRCTKAAGRRNLCIGWHRLCKDERMRPTYRRRAVKFRGWSGYHRAERNPRRGCGVVAVVLGQSRCVGQYGGVVEPDRLCKTTGDALADRCKGCVPNSLLTSDRTSRTS